MLVKGTKLKDYLHVNNPTDVLLTDNTWKVEEIKNEGDFSSYILTNTLTNYSYLFSRVFGLEQISNNEFMAFKRYGYMGYNGEFCYELLRYNLDENTITISERLPEKYGWAPSDGDHSYAIIDVTHKKKKLIN